MCPEQNQRWQADREAGYSALRARDFETAQTHFRSALSRVCQYGPFDPRVSEAHADLAELFRAQGLLGEAEKELKRAILLQERRYGPSHPEPLRFAARLAELYVRARQWNKARPLLIRLMALQGRAGESVLDAATALRRLAEERAASGATAEAVLYCGYALELHAQELGEEHPEVAADYARLEELLADDERRPALNDFPTDTSTVQVACG